VENEIALRHLTHKQEFSYSVQLGKSQIQRAEIPKESCSRVVRYRTDVRSSRQDSGLKVSRQGENYNDQEDQSKASTRPVSPTGTIRPRRECPISSRIKTISKMVLMFLFSRTAFVLVTDFGRQTHL